MHIIAIIISVYKKLKQQKDFKKEKKKEKKTVTLTIKKIVFDSFKI